MLLVDGRLMHLIRRISHLLPTAFVADLVVHAQSPATETRLSDRYDALSCAIVKFSHPNGTGTGFFSNATGKVVTAAHVVYDRTFIQNESGAIRVKVDWKPELQVAAEGQAARAVPRTDVTDSAVRLTLKDLAIVETGIESPCYLPLGDSKNARIGESLLSMGYPGSATALTLHGGFLSSRHAAPKVGLATIGDRPIFAEEYEVLRVQMPITAGASGSPVVNANDEAIAVISALPRLWTGDLQKLIAAFQTRKGGSGILLSGFDTTQILAQLALIVREFESPGAALAVPVHYLEQERETNPEGQ